jgi:hypothetical protein
MWAKKLLRARYFVVMTDKESAIAFDGFNPDDFNDVLALHAQTVEVEIFYQRLGELVKQHQSAVNKLRGGPAEKRTNTSKSKKTTKTTKASKPVAKAKAKSTK